MLSLNYQPDLRNCFNGSVGKEIGSREQAICTTILVFPVKKEGSGSCLQYMKQMKNK